MSIDSIIRGLVVDLSMTVQGLVVIPHHVTDFASECFELRHMFVDDMLGKKMSKGESLPALSAFEWLRSLRSEVYHVRWYTISPEEINGCLMQAKIPTLNSGGQCRRERAF